MCNDNAYKKKNLEMSEISNAPDSIYAGRRCARLPFDVRLDPPTDYLSACSRTRTRPGHFFFLIRIRDISKLSLGPTGRPPKKRINFR